MRESLTLLGLYPSKNLRQVWSDIKGSTEELCHEMPARHEYEQVASFLDENLSCCKQHVYVFSYAGDDRNCGRTGTRLDGRVA